jgi:D-serine deaminase-like pyridoxal phosphate-dependent protein
MSLSLPDCTPKLIVDLNRLERNLKRMQQACTTAKVELWPHVKTHKCVTIARRQMELGAAGLTCAKLSEAEAMLPSGVRRVFLAHSLSTPSALERAASLQRKLDQLVLAITSLPHARVLASLVKNGPFTFPVALAVDTGVGREGLRTLAEAGELAAFLRKNPALRPISIYTHEGHAYNEPQERRAELIEAIWTRLLQFRHVLGEELPLWPGCSVTAESFARKKGVGAVRPGAYVFGDLLLADLTGTCRRADVALTVRSTVVDRPARDLALIDAGSKTFSSDHLPDGPYARAQDNRDLAVTRLNEEHGFVTGSDVDGLQIGETVDWIPAHVCPVVNLARQLTVISENSPCENWPIEAGGCNY